MDIKHEGPFFCFICIFRAILIFLKEIEQTFVMYFFDMEISSEKAEKNICSV